MAPKEGTYVLAYISRVTGEERVLKIGSGDAMARRFDMNECRPGETWLVRASDGHIVMWKGTMPWELREDDPFEGLS